MESKYVEGIKVSATVKERSKTKYTFYGGIQCGDLYDFETRIISPEFDIVGKVVIRIKKTGGKVRYVQTESGKKYSFNRLKNIRIL